MEIILSIIISILEIAITITIIYFTIRYAINKARKENMSKIDFSKDKEYYREILKKYSPQELSYIDDFKINARREIVAILLNLKLKQKIEINDNQIIIIDSKEEGLRKTERFVLQNVKDGKVKIENSGYIESYAQDEAIEDELIIKNTDMIKRIKNIKAKRIVQIIVLVVLFVILCNNLEKINQINNQTIETIFTILVIVISLIIFGFLFVSPIITFVYSLMQINSYHRTEKGEEVNKRIEGLKKYMIDYSLLNEKSKNELIIWEEYLIYSVIFDLNDTIVQEMSKLIEIEFEYGKIYFEKSR